MTQGVDGRDKDLVPLEHVRGSNGGDTWYVDIHAKELGAPGQTITLFTVATIDGREGRGLSVQEFKQLKGRVGMSFGGVAAWELVH